MDAGAQTGSTPITGEETQQATPPITETTKYILQPVDPSLKIKQEDMTDAVKTETNQVEQGEGDIPVCGVCRKYLLLLVGGSAILGLSMKG